MTLCSSALPHIYRPGGEHEPLPRIPKALLARRARDFRATPCCHYSTNVLSRQLGPARPLKQAPEPIAKQLRSLATARAACPPARGNALSGGRPPTPPAKDLPAARGNALSGGRPSTARACGHPAAAPERSRRAKGGLRPPSALLSLPPSAGPQPRLGLVEPKADHPPRRVAPHPP